jgi:acetyl-CoA C-acetyltransferase
MGSLSQVSAPALGSTALKTALSDTGLSPESINELYFGNVISANLGQAPATQVALGAGLPNTTPCTLVNKVCASGTKAIMLATQSIMLGHNEIVAAGGMENMSLAPHYVLHYRSGFKYGNTELVDALVRDGLQDAYSRKMMGDAGELCAAKYNITREMQDEYAIRSYNTALEAMKSGKLAQEIAPVSISVGRNTVTVNEDEEPGAVKFDKIPSLRPAFKPEGGTITAANASKINDGAAAVILASEEAVKAHNLKPLARIAGFADAARDPEWFTIAPADAIPIAAKRAGIKVADIDLFEINEAFSVVAIVNQQLLDVAPEKVNSRGGAVAFGHPIGMSGARLAISLAHSLHEQGKKYGAVGICNGGGGASALILEKV